MAFTAPGSNQLIEFSVENFRSIRDRVTLSMVAANLRSRNGELDQDAVIEVDTKLSLLKSAVIYGANASGKSNLVKALSFMRHFVFSSAIYGPGGRIETDPFQLDSVSKGRPSTFEVVLVLDGVQYRYGFSVTESRVATEWLYFTPTSREVALFTRDEAGISVSRNFPQGRGLERRTHDSALFLSVANTFNSPFAKRMAWWLSQSCMIMGRTGPDEYLSFAASRLQNGGSRAERIERLVSGLDTGIITLGVVDRASQVNWDEVPEAASWEPYLTSRHAVIDPGTPGTAVADFTVGTFESDGTRKLVGLAALAVEALEFGRVLVIDEIDSSLHPLVSASLIRLFNSSESNPRNAQLICTTHDTNLLDRRLLRRDQIYFTEKDRAASTRLYSLADFKLEKPKGGSRTIRNDASFARDYINGKYGAIPFVGDLARVFREEISEDDNLEHTPERISLSAEAR